MPHSKTSFTIATYNIFDGRSQERIIQNILTLIHNGAHVIALQEVWYTYRGVSMSKIIDAHLPKNFKSRYYLGNNESSYSYGEGMLWNTDVFSTASFSSLELPLKNRVTFSDKLFFWTVGITPQIYKRGALIGTFTCDNKKIRIANLHLDFQGGDDHRTKQLRALTDYLTRQPAVDHEIICGDFNTVGLFNKQAKILNLEKTLDGRFVSVLNKPYTSAIVQQLDYIFVKNLKVEEAKILKLRGSDHYPLLAKLNV